MMCQKCTDYYPGLHWNLDQILNFLYKVSLSVDTFKVLFSSLLKVMIAEKFFIRRAIDDRMNLETVK